uniref:Uncharacterized protein n=1 Tax=Tetranychus urticae TaxID=32264 RepID=T1KLZ4_TETUR
MKFYMCFILFFLGILICPSSSHHRTSKCSAEVKCTARVGEHVTEVKDNNGCVTGCSVRSP